MAGAVHGHPPPWNWERLDVKPLSLLERGGQGEIYRKATKGNQPLNSCQKPQGTGWLMLWKSSLPIRGYSKDQDRFKTPTVRGKFIFSYWGSRFVLAESSENYLILLFFITSFLFLGKWARFEQQLLIVPGWSNMKEHHCSHFTGTTRGGSKGSEGTFPAVGERITSWEHRAPVPATANK